MAKKKYNYKGTKITGTSPTAKVFKNSKIKKAKAKELYFNTDTGHVYKCVKGGAPDKATWKYKRTDIAEKPSIAVTGLGAPARKSGYTMQASWKVPASMVDKKKGDRATELEVYWYLNVDNSTDPKEFEVKKNEKTTSDTVNLDNFKATNKKTYTRQSFHPVKWGKYLKSVSVKVRGVNSKGAYPSKKAPMKERKFEAPRAPVISDLAFNAETGEVSCTITTNAGTDYKERYDTTYSMKVYYSNLNKWYTIYPNKYDNGVTRATSKTLKFDDPNYASREYGDYARVVVNATARGFAGNTAAKQKDFYIAYPAKAEIKSIKISGRSSSDKATIYVNTHHKTVTPVDRVKLEYLPNTEYSTASRIPGDAAWQTTDIIDNAECNSMAMPVTNLIPDAGRYSWVRLKTYHASEAVLHVYSEPKRVKDLETPVADASDDRIKIVSARPAGDGKSLVVVLVWDDGALPSTGTELTWDEEADTWKSTKEPSEHRFTWSDGPMEYEGETWPHSATITIKGLEEGETYYIRARRYNEGDVETYSEYSEPVTATTNERPETVGAVFDRFVPKGSGLNIYWTFSGNGIQKEWRIVSADGNTHIKSGEGSLGATQLSPQELEKTAVDGDVTFTVQVSTGSDFVVSDVYTVTIIEQPTLTLNAPAVMDRQPYEFTAIASVPSDLVVIVTSQGTSGQFPDGVRNQTNGDTIHSDVYRVQEWIAGYALTSDTEVKDKRYYRRDGDNYLVIDYLPTSDTEVVEDKAYFALSGEAYTRVQPVGTENPSEEGWYELPIGRNPSTEGWYEEIEGVSATVTLPTQLDFWDLGQYSMSVVAIDRQTNLRSTPALHNFSVLWEHQAPDIAPIDTYFLSADTEVIEGKNYYSYDSETQTYTVVITEGTENPSAEGWYEVSTTEFVTVTPIDEVDDAGYHHMAAQINLTPPVNALETDSYEIYRMTGDGAYLIGRNFPLTYTAVDEYAPFGEDLTNRYRIAIRTADGDVAFTDVEYVLESDVIRIDWAGSYVEYPYGLSISDSYRKDVAIRRHLDGGIHGYWNEGIERKGSLGTSAIKLIQQTDIDATRQLARYTGPAFVRTREGTAFEADVQITDLQAQNPQVMSIAIDATEIDLTDEFMLPTPYEIVEEG